VEDAWTLDLGQDTCCWAAVVLPQPLIVDASALQGGPLWVAPPPDDGANPGRTLCCLYQSFLC
jgi:hypothetical protein